jgi:hypothetical protein
MRRVPVYVHPLTVVATVAAIEALTLAAGVAGYQLTKRAVERVVNTPPPLRPKEPQ